MLLVHIFLALVRNMTLTPANKIPATLSGILLLKFLILLMILYLLVVKGTNVCIQNLGQWSDPHEQPQIVSTYSVGIGQCDGNPPLTFTPECWNGILPHPCQHPHAFDQIATIACQVRKFTNPGACQYVGYAFRRGMCGDTPFENREPPVTLRCGTPLYWGWETVTTISQLKSGWQGTCILDPKGTTRSHISISKHKKSKKGRRPRASDMFTSERCVSCYVGNDTSTIKIGLGVPASCSLFNITPCYWGRRREVIHRCKGEEGVLCYKLDWEQWMGMDAYGLQDNDNVPDSSTISIVQPSTVKDSEKTLTRVVRDQGQVLSLGHMNPGGVVLHTEGQCELCMARTKQGSFITKTLIFHTQLACKVKLPEQCTYNGTSYSICTDGGKIQCYDPQGPTHRYTIRIEAGSAVLANHDFYNINAPQSVIFDACRAMDEGPYECGSLAWRRTYSSNEKYICARRSNQRSACGTGTYCGDWKCIDFQTRGLSVHPGTISKFVQHRILYMTRMPANSSCWHHNCNLINLTFPVPRNWLGSSGKGDWKGVNDEYALGIDGTGSDPSVGLKIQIIQHNLHPLSQSLFHSYYQEVQKTSGLILPPKAQNMFLALAETIAKELTVKNCFVCGGTNMGEQWPWEAQELNYTEVYLNQANYTFQQAGEEIWAITTNLVGNVCYQRNRTDTRNSNVGSLRCQGIWENRNWWSGSLEPQPEEALEKMVGMSFLLNPEDDTLKWVTPKGLYWICGRFAYNCLPKDWYGSCVLGAIRPSFFLLPLQQRQLLGVPVYEEIGNIRSKRSTKDIHRGNWKDNEWPPERIIHYYGPATWAEDGTYGYRTPIYLLNRLIRLQAVVEIITNDTIAAMTHLAKESTKSRTYIMQNRLALDYLLAKEGGVCGKFNLTNCCIEIDDSGKVIQEIADKMVKVAHVPVQTWNGFNLHDIFSTWFPKLPGLQAIVAFIGLIAAGCVILPCILPIFVKTISNSLSLLAERKATAQVMALWNYQKEQDEKLNGEYVTLLVDSEGSQRGGYEEMQNQVSTEELAKSSGDYVMHQLEASAQV